ncbi:MAG TPA: hypothetical protein PK252_10840 [Bacteroidales bacterium]|nr:hypothetical protein [Bacteroidales bacterium]
MKNIFLLIIFAFQALILSGKADYPPCQAYTPQGKDTIDAIYSYSNALYAGIDNYIYVDKQKINFPVLVECTMGLAMEEDTMFIVVPSKPGKTIIRLYKEGDTTGMPVFEKEMEVLAFPKPYIKYDFDRLDTLKYLSLLRLKKTNKFSVALSDDLTNESKWFKVKSITVGYAIGHQYMTYSFESDTIGNEVIAKLYPGLEISLVFTISGRNGIVIRMLPIKVRIY